MVYAANDVTTRELLWQSLRSINSLVGSSPWLVTGDFNVVKETREASNYAESDLPGMLSFREVFDDVELMDHPWQGSLYTWSNGLATGFIARKLNRVLHDDHWAAAFPGLTVEFLPPLLSYHCSSLISVVSAKPAVRSSFKFFNFWISHPDFEEIVSRSWAIFFRGAPLYVLLQKLKQLHRDLKQLNKEHYWDITRKVADAKLLLERAQVGLLNGGFSEDLLAQEKQFNEQYNVLRAAEESFFRQKAKVRWLSLGDINTGYFHRMV